MKEKFLDRIWWQQTTGAIVGTVVGIILTFGTTAYIDHCKKEDIARKTVVMTLHNIDAAISNTRNMIRLLESTDSLCARAASLMPDRLGEMPADSLEMLYAQFISPYLYVSDKSTQEIFSHSFQVWESIDDVKVIGRIGNCYSELQECDKLYNGLQKKRVEIAYECNASRPSQGYPTTAETVLALLSLPDVKLFLEYQHSSVNLMRGLVDVVARLNDYNKQQLKVSQDELDEMGNLLDED